MATDDIGKLVLRLTLGVLLLLHGMHKILMGIDPISGMLADYHLPGFLAYFVYLGEVVAPVLVILGVLTRVGGVLIIINMIVAVALAGMSNLFVLSPSGGYALELEMFYLFGGLAVALLGAGRIAVLGPSVLN